MRRLEDALKKKNITVSLDPGTIERLDRERNLVKRSSYLQSLLDRILGRPI